MAGVFLSYDRDDTDQARPIALALEKAGHAVWWDLHVRGGAQFSKVIEEALKAADVVVVLWSANSVESAWVRDEAAVGRDTGRLVPVTIDGTPAPLGFRQFQTIDLIRWKGRGHPRQLDELLNAMGPATPNEPPASPIARPVRRRLRLAFPPWRIAAVLTLVVALIGGGWWWMSRGAAHTPVVAIDAGSGSETSRRVAHDLAVQLSNLQSTRPDAFQLITGSGNADLILLVDADDQPKGLRRDLSILSGANRSILWSATLQETPDKADDLSQRLTLTSERVLACGLEALSQQRERIDPATLKLYLGGCSQLEDIYGLGQYEPALAKVFEQVVAKAPHFEGAWAKLLMTESEAVRLPDPPRMLVDKLRAHIDQAQHLGLKIGEIHAAKAALLPTSDFLGAFALLDQGVEADPDNPLLYRLRGEEDQRVGRMNDAIGDASEALQLDPGSPALQDNYVSILAYGGRIDAAYAQLRKAEAMWPGAGNIRMARYRLDLRFGDPKQALALLEDQPGVDPAQRSFIEARIGPTPANIQRAIDEERVQYAQEPRYIGGLLQVLGQFGRVDEAIDVMLHYTRPDAIGYNAEVMFRPAMDVVWRDPRSIAAAAHVGFLRYWVKSGRWPDLCADPKLPYNCKQEAAKYRI